MDTKKNRSELKAYFKAHLIPTEEQFASFIDSGVNLIEDRIRTGPNDPLQLEAVGGAGTPRPGLAIYDLINDPAPAWTLDMQPAGTINGKPGFGAGLGITQGGHLTRLFLEAGDAGRVGVGTLQPEGQLHIVNTPQSADAGYNAQKSSLSLVLGSTAGDNLGSLKMYGASAADYGYQRAGHGALHWDSTGGAYRFNADSSVRGTKNGVLSLFSGSGTEAIRLQTHGKSYFAGNDAAALGVGTHNPERTLHAHSKNPVAARFSTPQGFTEIGNPSATHATITTSAQFLSFNKPLEVSQIQAPVGHSLSLHAGATQVTLQRDTHKVGIGTGTPAETLDVAGPVRMHRLESHVPAAAHSNAGSFVSQNNEPTYVNWYHKDQRSFYLQGDANIARWMADKASVIALQGGKVGIGTDAPRSHFQVDGGRAQFNTNNGTWATLFSRYNRNDQGTYLSVTDGETVFHYRNDEEVSQFRFTIHNTDTEREELKGLNANTHHVLRLRAEPAGGFVGINSDAHAALSVLGGGKYRTPNRQMHITQDVILFGGRNNGFEANSAQISAGLHEADSLNIMGMGRTWDQRRMTLYAEGGLRLHGYVGNPDPGDWGRGSLRVGDNTFKGEKIYSLVFGKDTANQLGIGTFPVENKPPELTGPGMGFHAKNDMGFAFFTSGYKPLASINAANGNAHFIGQVSAGTGLRVDGTVKTNYPDGSLHLSKDVLLFGGRNSGFEVNSAQISAGLHESESLCIIGMGRTGGARKVTMWAEGGFKVHGKTQLGETNIEHLTRKIWVATGNGPNDGRDSGKVTGRTLTFTKRFADTALRITYSDNLRVYSSGRHDASGRWEIRIDDKGIPGAPIYQDFYTHTGTTKNNHHIPCTIRGIAKGVSAGSHTVSVWVGGVPGHANHPDRYTGWNNSTWTIEVEEVRLY
ncbi:MAG: hypothetical protein AAFQ98_01300 [Bacteroidota bacterium]